MQIITKGMVVPGILGTWWLVDDKGNSTTRLSGDWVEQYVGQELAIVVLNEQTKPWFKFMAEILNGKEEKHEVAISGLTDPLEDMRAGGER